MSARGVQKDATGSSEQMPSLSGKRNSVMDPKANPEEGKGRFGNVAEVNSSVTSMTKMTSMMVRIISGIGDTNVEVELSTSYI